MTSKSEIRVAIKALVRGMTREERKRQSKVVFRKLLQNKQFLSSKKVSVYVSLDSREIQTKSIFEFCFKNKKRVFVPHFSRDSRDMKLFECFSLEDYRQMEVKEFGIKQLRESPIPREEALSSGGLDMILVPGVVFTKTGQRLGNGFGYYDNYLMKCFEGESRPLLIGLAFSQQMLNPFHRIVRHVYEFGFNPRIDSMIFRINISNILRKRIKFKAIEG